MNELLAKFAAVEIQSRGRVSPEDIAFCDHQQAAYESALSGYKELSALWSKMAAVQKEYTGSDTPEDNNDYSDYDSAIVRNYLSSEKGAWLSVEAIQNHVAALHRLFLEVLVHYFNETYHVREIETVEDYGNIGFDYLVTLTNDMAHVDYGHYIYYYSDTMQIKNWPLEGLVVEKQVDSDKRRGVVAMQKHA